jgi:phosphatidate cytidylyltransferase
MLQTRLITAFIALPIVLAGVFAGGLWFLVGAGIFALIAGWEYCHLMKTGGYHPTTFITLTLTLALIIDAHFNLQLSSPIITTILLLSLVWQLFRRDSTTPTVDWALTLAGGLYIGWGLAHLVALRQLAEGLPWVCLTLSATWLSDTFAYLVGRAVGRHKLWPRHSPGKTWEGLLGGVGGGLFGAAMIVPFTSTLTWGAALIIGAIIPIAGLFGDLSISMMKRQVGVKDSSNLFPGHGGFLDRVDSLLFVSIVVYYYVIWIR